MQKNGERKFGLVKGSREIGIGRLHRNFGLLVGVMRETIEKGI